MSAEEQVRRPRPLGLAEDVIPALLTIPDRGALDSSVPVDPTLYRFYEVLQVYGPTFKELINEDFGDGIMSAITFNLDFQRVDDDSGPRVVITMNGKFLPYQWD